MEASQKWRIHLINIISAGVKKSTHMHPPTALVPQETSYTTSWWNSRIRREEDSLIAAAYMLLPFWHQWPPDCGEAGRTQGACLLASAGSKASRLRHNTHALHTHTHGHALASPHVHGRQQLVTLFMEGLRKPQRTERTGTSHGGPAKTSESGRVSAQLYHSMTSSLIY